MTYTAKDSITFWLNTHIKRSLRYGILLLGVYAVIFNVIQTNTIDSASNDIEYVPSKEGSYYYFPSKPIHNIYSILNESIGLTILNDPQQNPLRNCSPTVQYRLRVPTLDATDTTASTWILQSMMISPQPQQTHKVTSTNLDVMPKLEGGDEIYVQWETNPVNSQDVNYMGVAQVTDQKDGTYLLKFIRPPMLQYNYTTKSGKGDNQELYQYGRLTIYYEYTCGIGSIFAPNKDQYTRGGEVFQTLTSTAVSHAINGSTTMTTKTWLVPRPYIHDFIPPNTIGNNSTTTATAELIDLSKYDKILAFGDSLIAQLVRRFSGEGSWSDNILWYQNVCQCLSSDADASSMIDKLHSRHGHQILRNFRRSKRIAIITGSASWDAMRGCVHEDMNDHVNAIRTFLNNVTTSYPNMDIYWKAPSAFFLHRYTTYVDAFNETYFQTLKPKYGIVPLKPRYINYHVPQQMYHVQKELMKELQIPFLDLYDSYYLSAPWTVPGDSRHFDDALTRLQLSYFWPGLLNKPIYTKT